jgi:hypothetical protein
MPHYGATLLRVYERREDRRRYALFAVWASLLVWGVFAIGVHHALVGSLFLTLYVTWSPWHYTGQNYGLAVMFLRRRGVAFDAVTKRLLYASFITSYLLIFLNLHWSPAGAYVPNDLGGTRYHLLRLGIPAALHAALFRPCWRCTCSRRWRPAGGSCGSPPPERSRPSPACC